MRRDRERRECGSADVIARRMSGPPDPIKPKVVGVVGSTALLLSLFPTTPTICYVSRQ